MINFYHKNDYINKAKYEEILNESNEIFEENIPFEIKLNEEKMSDEDIYREIIFSLIKNNTSDNDYISFNLKEELQFDSINNTKKTIEKIFKIINLNEEYIESNKIKSIKDLLDSKKINFYYLLLKYIFTDSIYIYNIPFLFEARKIIIKSIRNEISDLILLFYNKNKDKIEYIIKKLINSEYYISLLNKFIFNFLNEILQYYEYYLLKTKEKEIKLIKVIIDRTKDNDSNYDFSLIDFILPYDDLLKDYNRAKTDNNYIYALNLLFFDDKNIKNNENKIAEKKEFFIKFILAQKFNKLRPNDKNKLAEFFIDENKEEISKRYNKSLYDFYSEKIKEYKSQKKKKKSNDNNSSNLFNTEKKLLTVEKTKCLNSINEDNLFSFRKHLILNCFKRVRKKPKFPTLLKYKNI